LAAKAKKAGNDPLNTCTSLIRGSAVPEGFDRFFTSVPRDERHYWIASLYALLIPTERRRRLSAYFTPPHLAAHAIQVLKTNGIKLGRDRILDPASGGAAFLVPLASEVVHVLQSQGKSARQIIAAINGTIAGIEIEPELARLSKLMLQDLLKAETARTTKRLSVSIKQKDSLAMNPKPVFDAVIVNPPYGRVFKPSSELVEDYLEVISDGHVNRYALFIRQALRWTKPGGIVCVIAPMSFLGGPYFAQLRKYILTVGEVISLDPIEQRSELFLDVLCDVCVLTVRKRSGEPRAKLPTSSVLKFHEPPAFLGNLDVPSYPSERIWALPCSRQSDSFFEEGYSSLSEYGYSVRTGYFVWNREQERYRVGTTPRSHEVPLYWAHNIKPNKVSYPAISDDGKIGLAAIGRTSSAVIATDAILVQRTSNSRQKRRLVAGVIRQRSVPGGNGFVSENHTLLIVPDRNRKQAIDLATLSRLINSEEVDSRFRRISGTVSVSVRALRSLPLPTAEHVDKSFESESEDDAAARKAYKLTAQVIKSNHPSGGSR